MVIHQLNLDDQLMLKSQQYFISPINILKELVENSIDSKCENIAIYIKEDKIKVQDDGVGISYEDMKNIGYYKTSKISKNESLGYRGQALAAIECLCSLKIISCQDDIAYEKVGREIKESVRSKGTTVVVTDIFKNCPIRKKTIGKKSIIDLLFKYTIISPIKFSLSINGKLNYTSCKFTVTPIISLKNDNLSVKFFTKKNSEESLLFINKRPIAFKVKHINTILKYYSNIYYSSSSVYFHLFLTIQSYEIFAADKSRAYFDESIFDDISKLLSEHYQQSSLEKYKSEKDENSVIYSVIDEEEYFINDLFRKTENIKPKKRVQLEDKTNLIKEDKLKYKNLSLNYEQSENNLNLNYEQSENNLNLNYEQSENNLNLNYEQSENKNDISEYKNIKDERKILKNDFAEKLISEYKIKNITFSRTIFSDLKIIGQFNFGFILCKYKNFLIAIDQHSADECFNFHQYNKKILEKQQKLLKPIKINNIYSTQAIDNLIKHNFKIENDMIVAVPYLGNTIFSKKEIFEILDSGFSTSIKNIVATKACRTSIMIGKALKMDDMKRIVEQLNEVNVPWYCPHGRPVLNIIKEY